MRLYHAIRLYFSTDLTYRGALMGKWAEPELTFGFLAACLPVIPAFLKHLLRTPLGLRARRMWTQSPPSDGSSGAARHVHTIGSYGPSAEKGSRITKVVETDIEFQELTRESPRERSRASSRERGGEWGGVGQMASVGSLRG